MITLCLLHYLFAKPWSVTLNAKIYKSKVRNTKKKLFKTKKSLHELIDGQGQGTLDGWQVENKKINLS